jgi:phospholipase/carboxylesterase
MTKLHHYTWGPASGNAPKQIIVLLHGYGSNGQDLISLAPYWAPAVPDALFVSPDAPFPCEMGVGGQWFSLSEYTPEKLLEGAQIAAPLLDAYLDDVLNEYDLEDKDLALVGFSQGTMMSLYNGPRRSNQIAGVLGYSGALIGEEGLGAGTKPPIHLIHGASDSVVPVAAYHSAVKSLTENGFLVSGHTTPRLEHSIDEEGIESGSKFFSKIFS